MSKETLLEIVSTMPEEFSLDELLRKLRINDMINEALEDYRTGNYYTNEEMRAEIDKIKAGYKRNAA